MATAVEPTTTEGTPAAAPDPTETAAASPPVSATAPVVPETYDLKLPEGSKVDPAIVERTAAKARTLGLSNEAGQKLLDSEVADAVSREAELAQANQRAQTALMDAWAPGKGSEWKKQQETWTTEAKADPEIGGEKFNASVEAAGKALNRFDPKNELKGFLDETGFGRNPVVLKFLARIGHAAGESTMATGGAPAGGQPKSVVNKFYGATTPEPE